MSGCGPMSVVSPYGRANPLVARHHRPKAHRLITPRSRFESCTAHSTHRAWHRRPQYRASRVRAAPDAAAAVHARRVGTVHASQKSPANVEQPEEG
jgi:hypothetical protein